ncbi:iron-sulfur cluster assembly accessory protein [Neoehrlichia mikurensis]|uniref:Iron-sulfur cluster assembly accessory protein n=1 Tax=Neoehrlichia mikurensis TaxID=89586 RepID=A0A9Q9BWW6_9RICK|nr:iron-sulfur cluster assembly accessory protein [Neoehrlichia mikurensis]QXK91986.1 iron-sulfur cluster assembly accessory protein [Neoehrlichia mikurensis]QXK92443.1 iron-sulfur cluster assembly accessory protein [Neoehrlichia mikurensis]QXK93678.1 iron-sulfur cluster assembly accessory protein [Neoehrlichia mikurensis]UTO55351.1 iron-sulfur cluster assembly accessory protein [Neoehrlichia mikurensis]UTO56272.1 iron-sulfur cluster assembly accessory protein [Neoehrlichia mikurensis]
MSNLKNSSLILTDNAINKIKSLINQKNNSSIFKVSVEGGGCSGFQYKFSIDNSFSDDNDLDDDEYYEEEDDDDDFDELEGEKNASKSDIIISDNYGNPLVLIDRHSSKFLKDAIMDYIEDINGSGFTINNPSTKSRCGCGNSFSI